MSGQPLSRPGNERGSSNAGKPAPSGSASTAQINPSTNRIAYNAIRHICQGDQDAPPRSWLEENQCTRQDLLDAMRYGASWIVAELPVNGTNDQRLNYCIFKNVRDNIEASPTALHEARPGSRGAIADFIRDEVPVPKAGAAPKYLVAELPRAELVNSCAWIMSEAKVTGDRENSWFRR
ncbi:hypothetical protein LTR09_011749 [Extremus antarcticus]|uniref:Uncharacterized protein n=1 Tax=Extremus antarcticus TaxID=702011 RepID=A0AAJ0D605_9PEZI|nr:hypothetical protein LTR09_011749 [Extremus antarcticus]